jgi:outer membrane protein assembly factor BamB
VYAFHGETGHVEWQQQLGVPVNASVRATASDVYVGTSDGMMHRLAATSGERRSSLKLDAVLKPSTAPLITQDALLVLLADQGANYRALLSLDTALSRVKWRRPAPERWSTTRVFATTRTVVLGTPSGEVTAYCAADGAPAWSHKLADAPIRSIGGSDEILYVGTPQGALYAIRPPQSCM